MSDNPLAVSFGAAARVYDRGRPEYPASAVAWMLEPVRRGAVARVADVGAGTGKLTAAVRATGAEVTAVDPDEAMLAQLRVRVPGVPTSVGTAEKLPLADGAMDAVVVGQAWHWVDPVRASAEIGRVVGAGGVLGLIWNVRDGGVPWVARLGEIMGGSHAEQMLAAGDPPVAAPFGGVEARRWRWSRSIDREEFMALVHSRSAIITADEGRRAVIDRECAELFDGIGAVGENRVELPYLTCAFRAVATGLPA